MWIVNNNTPFATERCWVRDKNGAEVWLVAIKATFDIEPDGSLRLAAEQEAVHIAPKLREDSENPGLLYDTDLPHKKNNTDVLVEGHAYAPPGLQSRKVKVGLRIANINKILCVTGDRVWGKTLGQLSMSDPQPFVKMPITYERAYGGTDQISENPKHHDWEANNPAGCGFVTKGDHVIGKAAPNIEDPKSLISHWRQRPRPVGFGPIAGHWSPRVELAGTYDENWEQTRQPLLPDDFDERYYQCAPEDQQAAGHLKGGEQVDLVNLTPNGRLQFHLPRVSFYITTNFDDGSSEQHRAVLHTVTIKPDVPRVVLVWHTHLECHHKVLKLNSTSVRLKQRIMVSEQDKSQAAGM